MHCRGLTTTFKCGAQYYFVGLSINLTLIQIGYIVKHMPKIVQYLLYQVLLIVLSDF